MKASYRLASSLLLLTCYLFSCTSSEVNPSQGITNNNLTLSNTTDYKLQNNLNSLGEAKLLVVPCVFKGERSFSNDNLETIKKAFFGENLEKNGSYYSLKDYYQRTSLGKLALTGEVTDVMNIPYTIETLKSEGSYLPGVAASYLYDSPSFTSEFLKEYDTDNDGFLDSVAFVYSSPTSERTGFFWAWVANVETRANLSRPLTSRHMWIGIDFFADEDYLIDTHSIIHETGHLFGLRDYYPSDNYYLALGGHSMMDYNISDHDPYSKMLLGWANPTYYDFNNYNKATVTLSPFEKDNSFLLYKPNWNHSVMDEYLLIEYYTPTNLNLLDSKTQYSNRPLGFSKPGIKIYHVDSRVAKCVINEDSLSFKEYVSSIPEIYDTDTYYLIGASNNNEDSYTDASRKGRYKQIALIENKTYNTLQSGSAADDDSLFYEGDVFDSTTSAYLLNGKFNDGTSVALKISVDAINENGATLTLEYLGGTK